LLAFSLLGESVFSTGSMFLSNLTIFNNKYVVDKAGLAFSHSLFNFFNIFLKKSWIKLIMKPYMIVTVALFGLIVYQLKYQMELWKKVLVLTICMCLFPFVSNDYKLVHFYLPFMLYFESDVDKKINPLILTMIGFLFIPKRYFIFKNIQHSNGIGPNELLTPIILIFLLYLLLKKDKISMGT